jgi:hypothetical protein
MEPCLPNLLIVGVSKAGTTSLFSLLSQHPSICPSRVKEPHYFSPIRTGGKPQMSLEKYAGNFAACAGALYRVEATPVYFYGGRRTVDAISATLTEPRAVVSLRNPVDRMWSNWRFKLSRGELEGSFEEFVDACEAVLNGPPRGGEKAGSLRALITGRYIDFLGPWIEQMGDAFRVVFFDDLKKDPAALVDGLFHWLGLERGDLELDVTARNQTFEPRYAGVHRAGLRLRRLGGDRILRSPAGRLAAGAYRSMNTRESRAQLDPQMRSRLEETFEEPNRRLAEYLRSRGYDRLPDWLAGP